jgi:hypothetical protein
MGVEARLYNELNKGEIVVAMSGLAGHAVYLLGLLTTPKKRAAPPARHDRNRFYFL